MGKESMKIVQFSKFTAKIFAGFGIRSHVLGKMTKGFYTASSTSVLLFRVIASKLHFYISLQQQQGLIEL